MPDNNDKSLTKICGKCKEEKSLDMFHKDKNRKCGLACYCKECAKEYHLKNKESRKKYKKAYREKNKENIIKESKEYYLKNKESITKKLKAYREKNKESIAKTSKKSYLKNKENRIRKVKEYRLKNKDKINKRQRERKRNNHSYRLKHNVSSSFWQFMKGTKAKSTWKYVDYTVEELREHLESLFEEGMTWDNYGGKVIEGGWWLDHIIPQTEFDYLVEEDIRECWKLENLQPLWAVDNIRKGNKLDWEKDK